MLSTQVSRSRYFFLGLTGSGRSGVIPTYGGFEQCNPDYVIEREHPEMAAIELVVAGRGMVRLNGGAMPLEPGVLYYYDRRTRLEISSDPAQPMAKYFLCLSGAGAPARLRAAGLRPATAVRLALFAEVQHGFEELIREGQHHRPATERICRALVEILLLKIGDLAGLSGEKGRGAEATFLRCRAAVENQAARLHTLGEIAAAVGVEASQLCRLFRRYQGISPYQFLLRRKMALAAERLLEPGVRVKEAAAAVGFADPFHFSRCFKQVHRVSPKLFQDSLRHR